MELKFTLWNKNKIKKIQGLSKTNNFFKKKLNKTHKS